MFYVGPDKIKQEMLVSRAKALYHQSGYAWYLSFTAFCWSLNSFGYK